MGNRVLKESICTSDQIDELSFFEEVFFYRLLVNCDDYGVMDARTKILKAKLFPLKDDEDLSTVAMENALETLQRIGLIRLYEAEGKPFLQVIKWAEHQRVRISKHKYPMPEEMQENPENGELPQVAASCGELPQNAADCRLNPNPNTNTNTNTNPTRARAGDAFEAFWSAYPNKVKKPNALKVWEKLKPEAELVARIMQGLARWKDSDQWTRDGGRFIPHPATWLNARQWEDEVQPRKQKTVAAQEYQQRDYSVVQERVMADVAKDMEAFKAGGVA